MPSPTTRPKAYSTFPATHATPHAAPDKYRKRTLTPEEERVRLWITEHHGILSRIAREHSVSAQFVQQIAYGRSTAVPGHPVERTLSEHGWIPPGRRPITR